MKLIIELTTRDDSAVEKPVFAGGLGLRLEFNALDGEIEGAWLMIERGRIWAIPVDVAWDMLGGQADSVVQELYRRADDARLAAG